MNDQRESDLAVNSEAFQGHAVRGTCGVWHRVKLKSKTHYIICQSIQKRRTSYSSITVTKIVSQSFTVGVN